MRDGVRDEGRRGSLLSLAPDPACHPPRHPYHPRQYPSLAEHVAAVVLTGPAATQQN